MREKEIYEEFLSKETIFNAQLLDALRLIEGVNNCLDKAEQLIEDRKVLEALRMLESKFYVSVRVHNADLKILGN
jgi:centromere/kinetochore protein ZW10